MPDVYDALGRTADAPATRHFALAVNADADLAIKPRAIYCQASGSITIRDEAGTDLPYAMTAGQMITFRGVRITAMSGTFYGWF